MLQEAQSKDLRFSKYSKIHNLLPCSFMYWGFCMYISCWQNSNIFQDKTHTYEPSVTHIRSYSVNVERQGYQKFFFFQCKLFKLNTRFKKQHSQKEFNTSTTGTKVHPSFRVLFTSLQSFKHCINYHIGVRGYKFAFRKEVNTLHFRQCICTMRAFVMKNQWLREWFSTDSVVFSVRPPKNQSCRLKICLHLNWLSPPCSHFQLAVSVLGFGGLWHMSRQWCSPLISGGHSRLKCTISQNSKVYALRDCNLTHREHTLPFTKVSMLFLRRELKYSRRVSVVNWINSVI